MITFDHVALKATAGTVIENVSFSVEPGECVAITGSRGSGKTLLLQALLGETKPLRGQVTVDEVNLSVLPPNLLQMYRQGIGIMLQHDQLILEKTVAANIALALTTRNIAKPDAMERVVALLTETKLLPKAGSLPEALNSGEKRRAALAQALAHEPMILIADEPVTDIDEESAAIILALLKKAHSQGATVIVTTHNPKTIASLGARILRLEKGKIVQGTEKQPTQNAPAMTAWKVTHSITPTKL